MFKSSKSSRADRNEDHVAVAEHHEEHLRPPGGDEPRDVLGHAITETHITVLHASPEHPFRIQIITMIRHSTFAPGVYCRPIGSTDTPAGALSKLSNVKNNPSGDCKLLARVTDLNVFVIQLLICRPIELLASCGEFSMSGLWLTSKEAVGDL